MVVGYIDCMDLNICTQSIQPSSMSTGFPEHDLPQNTRKVLIIWVIMQANICPFPATAIIL